ncbi:MAG: hypothetical protein J6Y94_09345 [Bacteriovoracaceae bacterium]|nr:hypothetical protein [Bacteriovoracaceae bacterium]
MRLAKSIGRLQRHYGNFAHKIRGYAYLKALGGPGIRRMSALAVLANRYIMHELKVDQDASKYFTILPAGTTQVPRMHEFILALKPELFEHIVQAGVASANVIAYTGKLFLDFGIHAPTVAFPEVYGLMIEPTESFSKAQLDQFIQILKNIGELLSEHPEVLLTAPHFTPVDKIDEVGMNKNLILQGPWNMLPTVFPNRIRPEELLKLPWKKLKEQILAAHQQATGPAPSA